VLLLRKIVSFKANSLSPTDILSWKSKRRRYDRKNKKIAYVQGSTILQRAAVIFCSLQKGKRSLMCVSTVFQIERRELHEVFS